VVRKEETLENGQVIKTWFDALGREMQNESKNFAGTAVTVRMAYNALGQLTSVSEPYFSSPQLFTTYSYDTYGRVTTEASKPKEQVIKVYNAAGMATEYGYDAVGRNTKITEKIDAGKSIILEYKYNAKNQVEQFIYPGGKALKYEYAYGDLKKMTWAPTGTVVWEKLSDNAKGQVLSAKAGNGLQTNYQYTAAGTPTSIKAMNGSAAMLSISYPSVDSRGNISQRKDEYKGLSETFIHDNLNRLSSNQVVVSYATNGNITSKVGVGNYTYNSSKPYAVSRLENISDGSLMTDNLTITYNSINRPLEVAISSTHKYTLTYGTNNQRVKSVYVKPGATTQTKYYAGPYEEIVVILNK
jgi:hypothetical protein